MTLEATPSPSTGGGGSGGGGDDEPREPPPDAPRNLLLAFGDGQVTLTWEAPEDDGGSAITDYEYRIDQTGEWISIGSTDTTHTVTGLVNGTEYAFEVRAVTAAGSSAPSNRVEATPRAPVTLLVANFLNGNNGAFNSRVYLWNPSTSAGQVTARVFTLPLTTGIARELTGPPLDLGTLEARSALNLKPQTGRRYPHPSGNRTALYGRRGQSDTGVYDSSGPCARRGSGLFLRLCLRDLSDARDSLHFERKSDRFGC